MSEQQVHNEIINAIREMGTIKAPGTDRPVNVNFPNDPNKTKVLPYMNVFLLSAPIVQPFIGVELRKQQLVQTDYFVELGVSLDTLYGYVDSLGKQFRNYKRFGLTRVASPPGITFRGEEETAYRLSLTFVMEYITN